MEDIDLSENLLKNFEDFQKILLYRRESLLNLSLSQLTSQLLSLAREPTFIFGDLFLEFLMKLSYALYLKSKLLLNFSEEENLQEESLLDTCSYEEKKREFFYLWALSLDRVLEEKVFLPRVNGFENGIINEERGDLNLLIRTFIHYLEKIKNEPVIKLEFSEKNIEEYLEDLRGYIYRERFFTWEEFLESKGALSLLEIVFYFLSLLFLVFYGECEVHQDEGGVIQIFLKE